MWMIRRAVDLTVPLGETTPVYPGDPPVRIRAEASLPHDSCNLSSISLGSHAGTHLDAPFHVDPGGRTVDQIDPALCAAEGAVIRLSAGCAGEASIGPAELAPFLDRLAPGKIALLCTGWSARAGTPAYFLHPYLEPEGCRLLLDRGIRAIGIDAPGLDRPGDSALPVHRMVAARGGVILENLVNLELLDFPRPLVLFFPLKLAGADGSPVRAVALEVVAGFRGAAVAGGGRRGEGRVRRRQGTEPPSPGMRVQGGLPPGLQPLLRRHITGGRVKDGYTWSAD